MLTSNHIQFSAYCHDCDMPIETIPATEENHRGIALNHSRECGHTCSLYKILGVLRNYEFVPTNKTEIARFLNGEEYEES